MCRLWLSRAAAAEGGGRTAGGGSDTECSMMCRTQVRQPCPPPPPLPLCHRSNPAPMAQMQLPRVRALAERLRAATYCYDAALQVGGGAAGAWLLTRLSQAPSPGALALALLSPVCGVASHSTLQPTTCPLSPPPPSRTSACCQTCWPTTGGWWWCGGVVCGGVWMGGRGWVRASLCARQSAARMRWEGCTRAACLPPAPACPRPPPPAPPTHHAPPAQAVGGVHGSPGLAHRGCGRAAHPAAARPAAAGDAGAAGALLAGREKVCVE